MPPSASGNASSAHHLLFNKFVVLPLAGASGDPARFAGVKNRASLRAHEQLRSVAAREMPHSLAAALSMSPWHDGSAAPGQGAGGQRASAHRPGEGWDAFGISFVFAHRSTNAQLCQEYDAH